MTTKYDDEILELSTQWISMDEIVKDHNEDKQSIIQAVNRLENMGYLESRNIKNIILYKNQNKVKDHKQMVENLKRGDQIVTSGGIVGTIERVMDNDRAEVIIGDDTKVEIVRSTGVQGLVKAQEAKK